LRKEFSSFDVTVAVRELKAVIPSSRINNVYQPDRKTLFFKLHKVDTPAQGLILEAGRRLHLTFYTAEKPLTPSAFCMGLRKHLRNALLTSLEQYEFERVVTFEFRTSAGDLRLILELFGDGNIILLDDHGRILQALSYRRMRDRSIVPHEVFRFAPAASKNPVKLTREEFVQELKASADVEVVRVLARRLGVGGIYSEETLLRAAVDKNRLSGMLSGDEVNRIFDALRSLLIQASTGAIESFIVLDEEERFLDVLPFRLQLYENARLKLRPCTSFNEALDEFYTSVASVERALSDMKVDQLKKEAERLERILADQQNALAAAERQSIENRSIGDAIYSHSAELGRLLSRFASTDHKRERLEVAVGDVLSGRNGDVSPNVFLESVDNRTSVIKVCVEGLHFELSLRKSLFENAAEFYEKSKRAKQKLEGATAALKDTQKRLAEVRANLNSAEALEHAKPAAALEELSRRKVKRKEWFEKFHWFTSTDGFLVVAGKDAVSNEVLVKKHCAPKDIVFHAEALGAPFVVVKTADRQPSEQAFEEASEFAAAHSRGWREGFASIDVFWVKPEQLGKGGPSGQYVPRGSFVVSGKRNWRRNVPLRTAVGVLIGKSGVEGFVGGPPSSVGAKTQVYVTIHPGGLAGKKLFNEVLKALAEKIPKDQRQRVLEASLEEIRELIPYSVGKVARLASNIL
jgi:predicted ribosome quality control (RQC) complex YloA/Tae2 family protein